MSIHEGKKYNCNQCDYQATTKNNLTTDKKSLERNMTATSVTTKQPLIATSPHTIRQFMKTRSTTDSDMEVAPPPKKAILRGATLKSED